MRGDGGGVLSGAQLPGHGQQHALDLHVPYGAVERVVRGGIGHAGLLQAAGELLGERKHARPGKRGLKIHAELHAQLLQHAGAEHHVVHDVGRQVEVAHHVGYAWGQQVDVAALHVQNFVLKVTPARPADQYGQLVFVVVLMQLGHPTLRERAGKLQRGGSSFRRHKGGFFLSHIVSSGHFMQLSYNIARAMSRVIHIPHVGKRICDMHHFLPGRGLKSV